MLLVGLVRLMDERYFAVTELLSSGGYIPLQIVTTSIPLVLWEDLA